MARLRDLLAAKDQLRELEGWRVRSSLVSLKRTLGVFEGNTRELRVFLGGYERAAGSPAIDLLSEPQGFEDFLDETDRLLHNFLAGAESLRDHAANIKRLHLPDLHGDADTGECHDREYAVFRSPVGSFVQELRNHVLHERIPKTGGYAVWSTDPAELKSGIALDRSELEAARTWSRQANRYMKEAGDSILIHEIVTDYRDLVVGFYQWFDEAIRRRNREALDELTSREEEVSKALKAAWGPAVSD
jgi:hypothetical protein